MASEHVKEHGHTDPAEEGTISKSDSIHRLPDQLVQRVCISYLLEN